MHCNVFRIGAVTYRNGVPQKRIEVAVWFWAEQESAGMIYRLKPSHFQLWPAVI